MSDVIELKKISPRRKGSYVKNKKRFSLFITGLLMVCLSLTFLVYAIIHRINTPSKPASEQTVQTASLPATEGQTDLSPLEGGQASLPVYGPPRYNMVENTLPVEHIFFHPLIAYPELAFDGDYMAKGFDDWFVTVSEFNKIIQSLYDNNYVLVNLNDVYERKNIDGKESYVQKSFLIQEGKKPLVLSIDDVNYYPYMIHNGTIQKLVLDENGEVAAYTTPPGGEPEMRRDLDIVPLVDDFVKLHPDFSNNGAKGCIALTGYEGVLGYRTYEKNNPNRQAEIDGAVPVIRQLKATGWYFASHSYAHYDTAKMSYESFEADTQKWKNEVESLIGPTAIYIYPYGSGVKSTDPKFAMLSRSGFSMMCTVGSGAYYKYTDLGVMTQRWHIDGIALRTQGRMTRQFYDADAVIDPVRK